MIVNVDALVSFLLPECRTDICCSGRWQLVEKTSRLRYNAIGIFMLWGDCNAAYSNM